MSTAIQCEPCGGTGIEKFHAEMARKDFKDCPMCKGTGWSGARDDSMRKAIDARMPHGQRLEPYAQEKPT